MKLLAANHATRDDDDFSSACYTIRRIPESHIRAVFVRLNKIIKEENAFRKKFYDLCKEYYGEEYFDINMSDDSIVDALDKGNAVITFKEFNEIMSRKNT